MFESLESLVQAFKEAIEDLGLAATVRTVTEQWEGAAAPYVEVVVSVGRDEESQAGPVADLYIYPVRANVCEVEVEVTLPAHAVTLAPAQLWARAKEIAGTEVGISGIQRYFRGEAGKTVHIHLESHYIIDYWFEVEVPEEADSAEEVWETFETEISGIAAGVVGLVGLGNEEG